MIAAPRRRAVGKTPALTPTVRSFTFDFAGGTLGWEAGHSDYNVNTADMRVVNELRGTRWYLSGWNYADDLFLFLKRRLTAADGVVANQNYIVSYTVTFETQAGRQCAGIGGAPGESVVIKLGASPIEPKPTLFSTYIGMSVDKGNQMQSGVHASNAGTISAETEIPCGDNAPYVPVIRSHTHPYAIPASSTSDLWLLFGTDSGFEGFNSLYVQRIDVTITPLAASDPRVRWQGTYAEIAETVADLQRGGVIVNVLPWWIGVRFDEIDARELSYAIGQPGDLQEIRFYVFDTADAAQRATTLISPDGRRIGAINTDWIAPPHFFMGDHLIVNYVGSSPTVLSILEQRFGSQFAGE
jgi:hypothetical protein